jgi:glycosyltransferase involved in cell wall biosynthesis
MSLSGMIAGPQPLSAKLRLMGRGIRDLVPAAYEKSRLSMMDESDWIATVSPPACESIRSYAQALGRPGVAAKVMTVPHPVSPLFTYTGDAKENRVLCVGRWLPGDHHQKDPRTLMRVALGFLHARKDWTFELLGRGATALAREIRQQEQTVRSRLILTEHLDRHELRDHYLASRILLCPSRYESFHISSAEALCCGCSIVVADHPLLASTGWFTTRQSGTLAASRSPSELLGTLLTEADAWDSGNRSAQTIASAWSADLHAPSVASRLIQSIKQAS